MPVAPAPDGREYADRLMTAAQRQSAEWAKAGAKGAQKDLQKTIDSLRGQLSTEELAALLKDLQGGKLIPDIWTKLEDPGPDVLY